MRVTMYILGEKGYKSLMAIPEGFRKQIDTIVIGTDSSVQDDYSSKSTRYCEEHSLNHSQNRETTTTADYIIAIGWRWLIEANPSQTLIVMHDSILPRYRGFNPLVTALINGDSEIGVTALLGTENYDEGDIVAIEKLKIRYPITISEAISKLSEKYGILVQKVIGYISKGEVPRTPQDHTLATYSVWRDKYDYFIDWNWNAEKIERMVNAVGHPYSGAQIRVNDQIYKLVKAQAVPDVNVENRTPGKVLFKKQDKLVVLCGTGLLRLDEVHNTENEKVTFQNKFRIRFT
ncbi:MAG: methionyl-tRNA formyltransferase [Aureisphaera sp.]